MYLYNHTLTHIHTSTYTYTTMHSHLHIPTHTQHENTQTKAYPHTHKHTHSHTHTTQPLTSPSEQDGMGWMEEENKEREECRQMEVSRVAPGMGCVPAQHVQETQSYSQQTC